MTATELLVLYLLAGILFVERRMKRKGIAWKNIPDDFNIRMAIAGAEHETIPEMQMQCHRVSQQSVDLMVKLTLEKFSEPGISWDKVSGIWQHY